MKKKTMKLTNTGLTIIILGFFIFMIGCENDDESSKVVRCSQCELEPMVGPCNQALPRYYFDKKEDKCKEFIWGGCLGVVPFETREECLLCACN